MKLIRSDPQRQVLRYCLEVEENGRTLDDLPIKGKGYGAVLLLHVRRIVGFDYQNPIRVA